MATKTMAVISPVRQQAENLAKANREADPDIVDVYWFPVETARARRPGLQG